MKYKQGGEIGINDWVKHRQSGVLGKVKDFDDKCGILIVSWEWAPYRNLIDRHTRPKTIVKAEPEDLI